MAQEQQVPASMEEIRQSLYELRERENRLNQRLAKLANLFREYSVVEMELSEEEEQAREALMEEIHSTLEAIRACSKYQAQFSLLLKEMAGHNSSDE